MKSQDKSTKPLVERALNSKRLSKETFYYINPEGATYFHLSQHRIWETNTGWQALPPEIEAILRLR